MLETNRYISERLRAHYVYICPHFVKEQQLLGLFHYGSGNYNLFTEESDVDTYAIVIPTITELCSGKEPINKEVPIIDENGKEEHIVLKDIRLFLKELKKGSFTSFEILATEHHFINKQYSALWKTYFNDNFLKKMFLNYNPYGFVSSLWGLAKNLIFKLNISPKDMAQVLRIKYTLHNFAGINPTLKNCFFISNDCIRDKILRVKYGEETVSAQEKFDIYEEISKIRDAYESYRRGNSDLPITQGRIKAFDEQLDSIITTLVMAQTYQSSMVYY